MTMTIGRALAVGHKSLHEAQGRGPWRAADALCFVKADGRLALRGPEPIPGWRLLVRLRTTWPARFCSYMRGCNLIRGSKLALHFWWQLQIWGQAVIHKEDRLVVGLDMQAFIQYAWPCGFQLAGLQRYLQPESLQPTARAQLSAPATQLQAVNAASDCTYPRTWESCAAATLHWPTM